MQAITPFARLLAVLLLCVLGVGASAQTPAKPHYFFNDHVGLVSRDVLYELNERLAGAERRTSNQVLVVIYPRLPDGQVLEDYTLGAFRAWGVGRAHRDNGIVLFVFMDGGNGHGADRLEVGRGLEGVVSDATAKRLLAEVLNPALKRKAYEAGFRAVVDELLRLTGNEFSGDGRTQAEANRADRWLEAGGETPDAPLQAAVGLAQRVVVPISLGMLLVMAAWRLVSWCRSGPTGRPGPNTPSRPETELSGHSGGGFWTGAALGTLLSEEGRTSSRVDHAPGGDAGPTSNDADGGSSWPSGFEGGGGTAGGGGASDAF